MTTSTTTALNRRDLRTIDAALVEEAGRLRDHIQIAVGELDDLRDDMAGHDEIDDNVARLGTERSESEARLATQRLGLVTAARRRIEAGTYGRCEDCDQPIARERLEALPTAERCIRCESRRRHRD